LARAKKTPFAPWESTKPNGIEARYIRMGDTQMLNQNMMKLNATAFRVYLYMKIESGGKQIFEFPRCKYIKICSQDGFKKALFELITYGFVEVAENNANIRKPNKYRFSENWRNA